MVEHGKSRLHNGLRAMSARSALFAALAAAILVPAFPAPAARAQPADAAGEDCGKAAWPLLDARAQLSAPGLREVSSGGHLALPLDSAVELLLIPQAGAHLPHPPHAASGDGAGGAWAGVYGLDVPASGGVWQVTLSTSAWIDVLVDGRALEPVAFTGVHACPGVRKSLRFRMPQGQATLQVSGAGGERLRLLAAPAE